MKPAAPLLKLALMLLGLAAALGPAAAPSRADFYVIPVPFMTFKGDWDQNAAYNQSEVVFYLGSSYFSLVAANKGHIPLVSPTFWTLLAQKGSTGATGPQGLQGLTGPIGPIGPQGPAGASPWVLSGLNTYYTQGKVGIGTSTPAFPLQAAGGTTFTAFFSINGAVGGAGALYAVNTAGSGAGIGVHGRSYSTDPNAAGVLGSATGAGAGVKGSNPSVSGVGVVGAAPGASGIGVKGLGGNSGIWGESNSGGGAGVYGKNHRHRQR